jgi:hypothetical protein
VSSAGESVRLTDDPTVQPETFGSWSSCVRWAFGNGKVDGMVTYTARRYAPDGTISELGIFGITFDPDTLEPGFTPLAPTLIPGLDLNYYISEEWGPMTNTWYDWSPDGTMIAYGRSGVGVVVKEIATGASWILAPDGCAPRWSPVRADGSTKVAFFVVEDRSIHMSNPDGTGRALAVRSMGITDTITAKYLDGRFAWSPAGDNLVFQVTSTRRAFITILLYRTNSLGGSTRQLTDREPASWLMGWVAQ